METEWRLNPEPDAKTVESFYSELLSNSSKQDSQSKIAYKTLVHILVQRGITSISDAIKFNDFSLNSLHDPFLMKGMKKAIERIESAIENNEQVMIYGDYDVDGTTAVALMMDFFKDKIPSLVYYIPDRYKEGYGISFASIDFAHDNNIDLIIALDCGIKAVEKVAYAKKKGIDYIICDHHTPGDKIPNAVAVLDPKQKDCTYPYKELSGCAIGFKLCQAYSLKHQLNLYNLTQLLDFVAISLACDIVPITGENRVLTALGLEKINGAPRESIKQLLEISEEKAHFTVTDLVFNAGPKINAAGRISSGQEAVDLLLATNPKKVTEFYNQIIAHNQERKLTDKHITEEALAMVAEKPGFHKQFSTVVFKPDWHKGVIGIVASRLIEKHYQPTVVLTESDNGILSGSVRSIQNFNVYEALCHCEEHLIQFGGHMYAAGLTLKKENLRAFESAFEHHVKNLLNGEKQTPVIQVDEEIPLSELTPQLKTMLDKIAPYGPQNMQPVLMTKNVMATQNTRAVGGDKTHLKLEVTDGDLVIPGIAFGFGHLAEQLMEKPFSMVYTLDYNYWKGNKTLQLMVQDIKP